LDFKLLVYKGFSGAEFREFPGDCFGADGRETPVLLGFLQFRSRLGPHFKWDFFDRFRARGDLKGSRR
jgi:hypothetical protein